MTTRRRRKNISSPHDYQLSSEISMNNKFQELESQSLDRDTALSFPNSMFRVGEFFEKVKEAFQIVGHEGKIRVRFEFVLDETESPLDDIRQAIADDSQPV